MLKNHFIAVEKDLRARAIVPANSGHSLHKGTPREVFIREFLLKHLSEQVGIGSGEIIDAESKPGEQRNQIDVVIHRKDYPKLHFGAEIFAFLVESVIATVEVKSTLTEKELKKALRSAARVKRLQRNLISTVNMPNYGIKSEQPRILSYLVAYDGPAKMQTVHSWIKHSYDDEDLGIVYPPMGPTIEERVKVACPTIDGIFVLGKGFIHFDNTPLTFLTKEARAANPQDKWVISGTPSGSLLVLFFMLTVAVARFSGSILNPFPYFVDFSVPSLVTGD